MSMKDVIPFWFLLPPLQIIYQLKQIYILPLNSIDVNTSAFAKAAMYLSFIVQISPFPPNLV